jgi:glycosyltransferase involved in cell wall biosynthesis
MSAAAREPDVQVLRIGTSVSLYLILRNQMRILSEAGFRIVCVCEPDHWAAELRALGFEIWPIGMGRRPGPLQLASWSLRLFKALKRRRVQIVHTHNAYHGVAGRIVARLAGVPIVVQTVHNWYYLTPSNSARARLYRLAERLAARSCDMVFFLNADDFRYARESGLVPAGKSRFIGNGIDLAATSDALRAVDRAAARASLGLLANDVVITMLARLEPPKDHDTFLRGFAQILAREPRARALLVGYGLRRAEIEAQVRRLGLEQRVDLLGYRPDVAAILRASDMLVLTTVREGLARALVEGMLAGLPVVASDVVGTRAVIQHGTTGLLVPPGSAEALAAAVLGLIDNPALAGRLGQAARDYALRHLDERPAALLIGQAYRELLARRGLPAPIPNPVSVQP